MPALSLLIKPASSLCNLSCRYCFYHSLSSERTTKSYGLMSHDVLEIIVARALEESYGQLTFAFQGGEPTLCGLGYYQELVKLVDRYNTRQIPIQYTIQTNGLLIDSKWAEFLAEHKFLVGISLDGDKGLHDSLRVDNKSNGSFKQVMHAISLFDKYRIEYNILTVITERLARHPERVYRFYKKNNFNFLQFIPCLAPLGTNPEDDPHALSPNRYASFLLVLFNLWYADITQGMPISIRMFDNWVRMLSGERPEQCGVSGVCSCQLVLEADGGVYPCDFYVIDEWLLGNVADHAFIDLIKSEKAQAFVKESLAVPLECHNCDWYILCRNGCRRDRNLDAGVYGLNRYCAAMQSFFSQVHPRLSALARQWQQMRELGRPVPGPIPF